MGFRAPPPGGPHLDPKGSLYAARRDHTGNQGVGDDVKHLGGAIFRVVSRPISAIVRRMRGPREEE